VSGLSLVAVGDMSFGDHYVCASFGVDSLLRSAPDLDVFAKVKSVLRRGDIVFGNLETVLSEAGLSRNQLHSMHMRGRPQCVDYLVDAGFNVLSIANNHILQHGSEAFRETVELLRSRGITVVGLAEANGLNCAPAMLEVGGTEYVFLGYAFEKDKYFLGTTLYAQASEEHILDDIRRHKKRDNVLICSFHWGNEFIHYPSLAQIAMARSAIDAGCDLILGHHPHVLNGFEKYDERYIFYSLGNFVFDQVWNDACTQSMVVELTRKNRHFDLVTVSPLRIGSDYRPVIVTEDRFELKLNQLCSAIERTIEDNGREYLTEFRRLERRNRRRSWMYLLRRLHRYDRRILWQIVMDTLTRRFGLTRPQLFGGRTGRHD
jgi:poly-gamma-glutamate synthesis protein (capsule biosynthesis protein)